MTASLDEQLQDLDRQGHEAYTSGHLDKALDIYRQRLELASGDGKTDVVAHCHFSTGLILHDKGDWDNSIADLEKALKLQKELQQASTEDDDPAWPLAIATTHKNIAEVYRAVEKLDLALQQYEEAMQLEAKFAPNTLMLAETYNNIGTLFGEVGNYKMALDFHTPACVIREDLCPDTLTFSCSASNIGLILYKMGKLDSSLVYLEKALEIEKKHIPGTLDLADSYSNMAEVLCQMKEFDKALENFHHALQLKQEILTPPNDVTLDLSKTFTDLGYVYLQKKEFANAQKYLQQAVDLEEHLVPDSLELANTYSLLMESLQGQDLSTQEYEEKLNRIHRLQAEQQEELLKG